VEIGGKVKGESRIRQVRCVIGEWNMAHRRYGKLRWQQDGLLAAAVCAAGALAVRPALGQPTGNVDAHDPSTVIFDGSKYYYYCTGQGIVVHTSTDDVNWSLGTPVFATQPPWTTTAVPGFTGFFWAPDVIYRNNQYYLYYAVSTFGSKVSAIGLATSPTLNPTAANYGWTDQGPVLQSSNASNFNAIDPSILQDSTTGRMWMSYGSYNSGIFVRELDPTTGKFLTGSSAFNVAYHSSIEASALIQHGAYYYEMVAWGTCCSGINSTYQIMMGRSTSPTGPFLDRNGVNMLSNGGTVFYDDDGSRIGPGQFGFDTVGGQDQFSYHYYDGLRSGAPTFGLSNLYWTSDGWPSVAPTNPNWSGGTSSNWSAAGNWAYSGVPNGVGSIANFAANSANQYSVVLDAAETVSRINFTSATSFTIGNATGNTLTLAKMALDAQATINVSAGNHTIAAPIVTTNDVGVNVSPANSTLTLSGGMSAGTIYKFGHGVLVLGGTQTYTGQVDTRAGTLVITGAVTSGANMTAGHIAGDVGAIIISGNGSAVVSGDFNVGDTGDSSTPATGMLTLQNNAAVTVNSTGAFVVGAGFYTNTTATGTVNQTGGNLTANGNFDGAFIIGGRGSNLGTGTYNLVNGTVTANTNVRVGGYGTGTFNQSGGTFTSPSYVSIGRFAGAVGTWNISGGLLNVTNASRWLLVGESGTGKLNISGTGQVTTANVIRVGHNGGAGTVNLNGGMLTTLGIQRGTGTATFNFNGGTLVPTASGAAFMQGLTAANVQAGGAIINTNGMAITIGQALAHDAGLGATVDGGLTKNGPGTLTLGAAEAYTGNTVINQGLLNIAANNPNLHTLSGAGAMQVQTGITTTTDAVNLNALTVNGAEIVRPNGSSTSQLAALTLAGTTNAWTGRLEINDNALILATTDTTSKATILATLQNQIASGTAGNVGITSNTTAADPTHKVTVVVDNAVLGLTQFAGQGVDASDLLVESTYLGDANLDRRVDVTDLGALASNYGTMTSSGPLAGDFNGDGIVDVTDLGLLATNYGAGTAGVFSSNAGSVPEPASLAMMGLALPLLMRRRSARRTVGLGDVVATVAEPIAQTINAVAGTKIGDGKNCGCKRRQAWLNQIMPDVLRPFSRAGKASAA
jgi:autotransporter-associated beta strand protein/T5SS/PEP-CTERM-associated repeat protein